MSLWEKRSAKWHKYKRHKEKSFRLSCVFVLWIIKCHFGHKDSFLFAPFIAAVQKYSVHLTVESAMFMHLPNTEVRILHNSLSCDNYLIYRQQWRFDVFFFLLPPLIHFRVHFPPCNYFPQKSTIKVRTRSFQKHTDWFFFLFRFALRAVWLSEKNETCLFLRAHLKNIAGIVYQDSLSRADINRQRPSLRKQCNMLALGTAAHGTHSLSSMVTQPRTGFCRSTGFLSLIGGTWIDWRCCSMNHPRIAPTQIWVHLVMNNCRNQCFSYKEEPV